jgi:hypothetical protein
MNKGFPSHLKSLSLLQFSLEWVVSLCGMVLVFCSASAQVFGKGLAGVAAHAPVVEGGGGWLFLGTELRFLGVERFWGGAVQRKGAVPLQPTAGAGPLSAIVDFDRQLKAFGVRLLLLPVPPKAWVSKNAPAGDWAGVRADSLGGFYRELAAQGVDVLDLRPAFAAREAAGESMFCRTDSHWSGIGCVMAAQLVAERLRLQLPSESRSFKTQWREISIKGDLEELAGRPGAGGEAVRLREVSDAQGTALSSDPASPFLLIGDSHTLVFREFHGERAGLADQLAVETGTVPEVIGTRGSGANAVRLSVLRRNIKDPGYIGSKKVLVWCVAAREFTEADQGWQLIPLSRPEVKSK